VGQAFLPVLLALSVALPIVGATRPHYGGTLRVEMRARVTSLDPREMPSDPAEFAAAEKIFSLVFERLLGLDENGRPQPALAVAWQHDAEWKRWEFRMRPGVRFHDGAPLTPAEVAGALQRLNGPQRIATVSGESLVIQSERPMPDLLLELARGHNFIFHLAKDGSVVGTGPFRVTEWQRQVAPSSGSTSSSSASRAPSGDEEGTGRRLVLAAFDDHWAGRPFLDSISVEMGVVPQQQLIDLELGKADIVELAPDQVRRASQSGGKTWSSLPVELLALAFLRDRPAVQEASLRQAMAFSIDRATIWSALLQRQGEVAGGLLPQWLSGYAFLFSTPVDLERAKQLRSEVSATQRATRGPIRVAYDFTDSLARSVAERIAVNAREAGIAVQVAPPGPASAAGYDARLVRLRLVSTSAPTALESLLAALGETRSLRPDAPATPEQLYAAERAVVDSYRVLPLVHLPQSYGLSERVKNWMPRRWGTWRLEDVWLDTSSPAASGERP
jgi:peptide/nickel transport system substrate-binding protein